MIAAYIVTAALACPPGCPVDPEPACIGFCELHTLCDFLDWDGDSDVDCDDLSTFCLEFFTGKSCCNVNCDEQVDEDDLGDYITAFFQPFTGCPNPPSSCP